MIEVQGVTYYTAADIAAKVGVAQRTVQRFVSEANRHHYPHAKSRFDAKQFASICAFLIRCREVYPRQPLRAYRKIAREKAGRPP